jgi:hypothetical protein
VTKGELPELSPEPEGNFQWLVADTDFVMGVCGSEIEGATKSVGAGEGSESVAGVLLPVCDGMGTTG